LRLGPHDAEAEAHQAHAARPGVLLQDKDAYVKAIMRLARTRAAIAKNVMIGPPTPSALEASWRERVELMAEDAAVLEVYAMEVREGRVPPPW